jgi:hypothetical protein
MSKRCLFKFVNTSYKLRLIHTYMCIYLKYMFYCLKRINNGCVNIDISISVYLNGSFAFSPYYTYVVYFYLVKL